METKVKAVRKIILSFVINLETSVEYWGKNWQCRRSDFLEKIAKKMKKNSRKDSEFPKKEARQG